MKNNLSDFTFKSAVDATSTGIIITDHQAHDEPIVYANPQFLKLTGYNEKEVIGRNCRFLAGPDTNRQTTTKIREAVHREDYFQGEILNYRKDHSTFWNQLTLSPVKNSEGKTTFFVGIQQDVSVQKKAQQERDLLIRELTTINVGLSKFASTTSHELKNPLASLLLSAGLMKLKYAEFLDHEGKSLLSQVLANAKYLSRSIDELMQFSSLGTAPIAAEPVDLNLLLDEVVHYLGVNEAKKFVHVAVDLPEVCCNRSLMSLVIRNLIDNAVKYGMGRQKGVYIEASSRPEDPVEIIVKDHGAGIPKEVNGRIFEAFVTSGRTTGTGTGLGLAIVKRVIELHHGTIECHSSSNGTEFVIKLPRAA